MYVSRLSKNILFLLPNLCTVLLNAMQNKINIFLLSLIVMFLPLWASAQYEFIENKGQWNEKVNFKVELNNGAIFLEDDGLTFHFTDQEVGHHSHAHNDYEWHKSTTTRKGHVYKVEYKSANKSPKITKLDLQNSYCNYYIGNDESKWANHVNKFRRIEYSEIYHGIDAIYTSMNNMIKYDFVVHPNGNYRNIQLEYIGADALTLNDGILTVHTSVCDVTECRPLVYQIVNGDTIVLNCKYNLRKNILSFDIEKVYDKNSDIIIDPSLVFSTYTGSTGDNWGFTATYDYNDNVYSGGIVFATGYPTSTGAYQYNFAGGSPYIEAATSYQNGCDIGIIKYNSDGTQRLYATYLGGTTGQEMPHSLAVTENNELVIMGTTGSTDFPTSQNAFDQTFNGGSAVIYDNVIGFQNGVDIFVAKISEDGSRLLGGTYVGGSGNDGLNFKEYYTHPDPETGLLYVEQHGNDSLYFNYGDGARGEVIVDSNSGIYVGTNTFSNDFPSGINSGFQEESGGGQDGVVFKLSADLSQLVWSSYLGGSDDDAIFSISLDNKDDVFVTGGTISHDFPTTAGAYNTAHNGGSTDAFVARINPNGTFLVASTLFGSDQYDNSYFVRSDQFDNIVICGQTKCGGTTLVQNAGYYTANSGQFITKFNNDLDSVIWSTQFGNGNGRPNISITAFAVDVCNRIYLSGWGREWTFNYYNNQGDYYTWDSIFGTKGMEITADAIQDSTDGQDFYVMVLANDMSSLEYATFFGELHYANCWYSGRDHVDGGTSRFDKKGNIIQSVCASCGGCQEFPTSPANVWSSTNNATNCNNAVFKIRIIENLADANFNPVPAGCVPYRVTFENCSQGTSYLWDFGDGTTSTLTNPVHTYYTSGNYLVTLIAYDSMSCNQSDTISRMINVITPHPSALNDITICPGESVIIGPTSNYPEGTTFVWIQGENLNNPNIQNPSAYPTETTDYMLVAMGICNDTLTQHVIVKEPVISVTTSNDTVICPGGSATLTAYPSANAVATEWSCSSNFSTIISTTNQLSVSPTQNSSYYVRVREGECNTYATSQVNVQIHEFNYSLVPSHIICPGSSENLTVTNNNASDNLSFSWAPASSIISGANTASPTVSPSQPTTYYVTITNQMGCTTTDQVNIEIDHVTTAVDSIVNNICYDDCLGQIFVSANGIEPYSYHWDNGATQANASNFCNGNHTVTVTDSNGCTASISANISSPPQINGNFTNIVVPVCDGIGYGSASISANGGTPSYTYYWETNGNTSVSNNECLVGDNNVIVTDAYGCQRSFTINMPAPGDIVSQVTTHDNISCYGRCDGNAGVTASGGPTPYTYTWSTGATTPLVSNLCVGRYNITIVDAENCVSHQSIQITQPDTLVIHTFEASPVLCHGGVADISTITTGGVTPYTYMWSDGSTNATLNGIVAGHYSVVVSDAHGCLNQSEITISQPEQIQHSATLRNQICTNICNGQISTNVMGGTPPYFYSWSNGEQTSAISELCADDYSITITDRNGCAVINDFSIINEGYVPELSVTASSTDIFEGEIVRLLANADTTGSFRWDNGKLLNDDRIYNPLARPLENTTFEVVYTDHNGCINRDTITIKVREVICGDPYIFVPNAFTPNGDGNNDTFKPFFPNSLVEEIYFVVFDRWGNIVFETDNIRSDGWNGTLKGKQLAPDVYVYRLKAKCINGEEYEHDGNVTLLR